METTTPKTLMEAIRYYADLAVAEAYMVSKRWPDGVTCPHCGSTKVYRLETQRRWKCSGKHPQRQFSVKTGTIMEDSPLPLDKWLSATWMIVNDKNGISSYEIGRALGITQKSAWFLDHRIRHALSTGSFEKVSGTVEADESYVGGKLKNMKKGKLAEMRKAAQKPGRPPNSLAGLGGKAIVMGLLRRTDGDNPSQIQTCMIETAKKGHVQEVVRSYVEPGSIVMTDTLASYKTLQDQYIHFQINHAVEYAKGRIHTNGLENFWALLKRTIKGTYIAIEPFHLQAYLDEQAFRFNNRKLTDGERFARVMGMVSGKRITYAELTGKNTVGLAPTEPIC